MATRMDWLKNLETGTRVGIDDGHDPQRIVAYASVVEVTPDGFKLSNGMRFNREGMEVKSTEALDEAHRRIWEAA